MNEIQAIKELLAEYIEYKKSVLLFRGILAFSVIILLAIRFVF